MFGFYGSLGAPRLARRGAETVEQRLDRLERNFNNFHAEYERFLQYLEDRHVLENAAVGASAWQRVTNLWNILIREGVTRTPY